MLEKTLFLMTVSLLMSCEKILKSDKLHLEKKEFLGNQLRTDGYYSSPYSENKMTELFFLFRDGSFYTFATKNEPEEIKKNILSVIENQNKGIYGNRYFWGIFNIDKDCIIYERWVPSEIPHKAFTYSGTIQSDTTFEITESYRYNKNKKSNYSTLNKTYYFQEFEPKPDSTNDYTN